MEAGGRRAVAVWHRRAGKDSTALNFTAASAHERVGVYWHMLPEAAQARKVVWDGINPQGERMIDQAFPQALREATNKQEMKIELKCGSIWQLVGSDNYNSLIGANPVGVVFSEYSVADPAAWDYIRPILAENGGWALFIYTPRGRNHGHVLYDAARRSDKWFCQILKADETNAISEEAIAAEREAGMSEEMIGQEFYCSFDAPLVGSYYAKEMNKAEEEGRIGKIPYQPELPVNTAWDLGIGDPTAIWFYQRAGKEIHLIDYHEDSGESAAAYARVLQDKSQKYGYVYADHIAPHDMQAKELGTGVTREETFRNLKVKFRVLPVHRVDDGINASRSLLNRCWFDADKCKRGISCLQEYRKDWNDKLKVFKDHPLHDWTSHGADAFRYLAMGLRKPVNTSLKKQDTSWVV